MTPTITTNDIQRGESRVRCNVNHSGNRKLTFDCGYFQCAGCATWHSHESVFRAFEGPVYEIDGSGGVVRVK